MSSPAKPGDMKVTDHRYCLSNTVAAFVLGCAVGATGYAAIQPAQAIPQAVSATLMGVGQHLCKDWQGIKNVTRVSEKAYTFTCEKYASFTDLAVNTGGR